MKLIEHFPNGKVSLNLSRSTSSEDAFHTHVILYKTSTMRIIGYWLSIIFTAGISFLFMHWFLDLYIFVYYSRCANLRDAVSVLVVAGRTQPKQLAKLMSIRVPASEIDLATGRMNTLVNIDPSETLEKNFKTTYLFENGPYRYIYHDIVKEFCFVQFDYDSDVKSLLINHAHGIKSELIFEARRTIYGPGCIIAPLPPLYKLLAKEILQPIYIYQAFALILWYSDEYYSYASAVLLVTIFTLAQEIYGLRKNANRFRKLATDTESQLVLVPKEDLKAARVKNCDNWTKTLCFPDYMQTHETIQKPTEDLVPGDLIEITYGKLPCDMLLITGSILMNESMLSGESIPKSKSSLDSFSPTHSIASKTSTSYHQGSEYVLYGGTEVVQIKSSDTTKAVGLVVRTAFTTVRGRMLSTLFDPRALEDNRLIKETYKFLTVLAVVALIGAVSSVQMTMSYDLQTSVVIIRFFDTFTNLIAPILPASMAVGCTAALSRLKHLRKILCLQSTSILIAGEVNTLVFDKTGTLTEDCVTIDGYVPSVPYPVAKSSTANQETLLSSHQQDPVATIKPSDPAKECPLMIPSIKLIPILNLSSKYLFNQKVREAKELPLFFIDAISCCHSLIYWKDKLVGDLLEVQLFNDTARSLVEHNTPQIIPGHSNLWSQTEIRSGIAPDTIYILKRFEFKSECQRMSVLIYHERLKKFFIICKGSPEQLELRCELSTLPLDYADVLHKHTKAGKRVIAYGYKEIFPSAVSSICSEDGRNGGECNLTFMGLVLLINQLKSDTVSVIKALQEAGVHCKMATGDNAMTALAIAKECCFIASNSNQLCVLGILQSEYLGKETALTLRSETSAGPTTHGSTSSESDVSYENGSMMLTWKKVTFMTEDATEHFSVTVNPETHNVRRARKSGTNLLNDNANADYLKLHHASANQILDHCNCNSFTYSDCEKPSESHNFDTGNTMPSTPIPSANYTSKCNTDVTAGGQGLSENTYTSYANSTGQLFDDHFAALTDRSSTLTTQNLVDIINSNKYASVEIALTGPAYRHLAAMDSMENYKIYKKHRTIDTPYSQRSTFASYETRPKTKSLLNMNDKNRSRDKKTHDSGQNFMSFFAYCLRTCRIFARMTPQDKAHLIQQIQNLEGAPLVGMCGDGANDCEALRTSNVGISLSEDVTSICAHVTALSKSIQSSYDVLCEGRGALANGFSSCKYIILYAAIQFTSVMILYSYGGNLTDEEFMIVDIAFIIPLVVSAAWTHSSDILTSQMPLHRLTGPSVSLTILGQFMIQFLFLVSSLILVANKTFYVRFVPDPSKRRMDAEALKCFENTVIFLTSVWQYVTMNILVQRGTPWRKKRTSNMWYVCSLICTVALASLIFFAQDILKPFQEWLGLMDLPLLFRLELLGLCSLNYLVSVFYENIVIAAITRWEIGKDKPLFRIDHSRHFQC